MKLNPEPELSVKQKYLRKGFLQFSIPERKDKINDTPK